MRDLTEIRPPEGLEIAEKTTIEAEWVSRYPQRYQAVYRRGRSGKSRRNAIRAFCVQCMGFSAQDVAGCTAQCCPLFPYRMRG